MLAYRAVPVKLLFSRYGMCCGDNVTIGEAFLVVQAYRVCLGIAILLGQSVVDDVNLHSSIRGLFNSNIDGHT